jgi:hypothetical protein
MKPETKAIQSQIASLKRQVMANRVPSRKPPSIPPKPPPEGEWYVRSADGGTYTPGTDWNVNFDGINTASTGYLDSKHPAGGGWVQIGNQGGGRGWRARLVFDSESTFSVQIGIDIDSGTVQIQDNGRIQETSANGIFDLQFFKGRNCLEVFCDDLCVYARARVMAIDGILSKGVKQAIT